MTRGVMMVPPVPRKAPAARAARLGAFLRIVLALASVAPLFLPTQRAWAAKENALPEGPIVEVRVEGNVSITSDQVRAKILSREGSPLDQERIDADIQTLVGTKWFSDVAPYFDKSPDGKGFILTFVVKELPVLSHVEFRGLKHLKLKDVEENTGLKKGNRADAARTHLAVDQIRRLYAEKGYDTAEVTLLEGGERGQTRVVMQIFEGEKHKVGAIDFKGNVFATDATLRTKITSKVAILGLIGGKYNRDNLDEDIRKLTEYYQGQGFVEVSVRPVTRPGSSLGDLRITFVVSEGTRYKVRNIEFKGNKKLTTAKLREGLMLHSGQPILDTLKEADRKNLMTKYYEIGCIDTMIRPEPKYTDQQGIVDLVYEIEEGEPYLMGDLIIRGNDRTKDKVVRREALMAGFLPGEVLNLNRMDMFKQRLGNTGYFVMSPEMGGKPIDLKIINRRPAERPYGDGLIPDLTDGSTTRMQDPGPEPPALPPPVLVDPPADTGPGGLEPFGAGETFAPPRDVPPIDVPLNPVAPAPVVVPPGTPGAVSPTPPVGAGEPPGMEPSLPGMNMTDVGPDRQDPFPNRSFADVVTSVSEAPTGRFMAGIGASGFQGLNGSLTITEKNFDLFNVPRSFDDITSGKAFRGGGQDFQVSLMAGTLINRFTVSLRDPYLFDLPIGGGASGYLFQRVYPDWTESRGGGRFSLGRQFGTSTYADMAFRIEDVNFNGYRTPAPAEYLAATGHTTLATLRPTLRFDNRNSPFLPNKGQYLELSFEQGWGTFTYPKAEIEGRTYFTTGTRPDGSGPRILSFRGHFGVTGRDTPVYERFYAGYLGSLRGFQYRGVGPHVLGSNIGGTMMAIGSVEYMFPLIASDALRQVVFTDFGTVENGYNFTNIRASVGTGIRLTLPQFGPLPISFDLAFPVAKAPGDKVNYFNFSIGAVY
ncbi:BamA/OMP85 family outer membrane protein [Singulisphaera acidiphila]|uniref:Outer membrane protein/protective antigen OMA87 n=1 Tax=Singulisphaera acidiphila (strain ATCC BAA-1392 / DSM 18658 / VKM B-2454 / MOB10) TaxID=886293 RepID=L0DMP5_SINAD|nr:outer membrane protein assembly factor [Singulisphaera acidiphila]AGA30527.1 outer membrane protein/protective antigen OMA87 [Singulisphaera acidiphila DSM 18658]